MVYKYFYREFRALEFYTLEFESFYNYTKFLIIDFIITLGRGMF